MFPFSRYKSRFSNTTLGPRFDSRGVSAQAQQNPPNDGILVPISLCIGIGVYLSLHVFTDTNVNMLIHMDFVFITCKVRFPVSLVELESCWRLVGVQAGFEGVRRVPFIGFGWRISGPGRRYIPGPLRPLGQAATEWTARVTATTD